MKITRLLTFFLFSFFTLSLAQDLYDINNITTIDLTFKDSNWDALLDQLYSNGDEERLLATAVVNGILFDSVGVRYKGNSSYSDNNIKNPLNIKLDYMIDDQKYDNFGTLKLSNCFKDPSFVREVMGYEIARKYMPASLSNFAKVTINGTYFGLFTSNQDVDKHFTQTYFGSKSNPFFKGEPDRNKQSVKMGIWGFGGTDTSIYKGYFELESDYGWDELVNFLDVFNNDLGSVEDVLNVDRHLWMLAFDNLLVNLDAPINIEHNYYICQDNAERFNPILWDLNMCFGGFKKIQASSDITSSGMQQLDPYMNENNSSYPIIKQVLANDSYKKMYVAHMKTIIQDYFSNDVYRDRILELQDIIDSEVQDDPNKFYTYDNFLTNVDASISVTSSRPGQSSTIIGLTQLMNARVDFLNSHSDFVATAPAISNLSISPLEPKMGDVITFNCNISSGDIVKLCYRKSVNDVFTKIDMFDDGKHEDENVDDGIYGVQINANSSYLEYYIYSENDEAASFMPEGAEYSVNKLNISGQIVLNEFMADNKSTISDAHGDFDDWIEIYNNTENNISLSGYYLSDKISNLTKWAFPDTSIPAYSYLIVWVDEDEDDSELHATFKLSASGEAIYLVDPSLKVLDEIIFGAQTSDISQGRYENGVGNWIFMTPTFSAENIQTQSLIDDEIALLPTEFTLKPNYPNPFNPTTNIPFSLPESGMISLRIYDASGCLIDVILNEIHCSAGHYSYQWNASLFSSGVYIAVLDNGLQLSTQKLIFLK